MKTRKQKNWFRYAASNCVARFQHIGVHIVSRSGCLRDGSIIGVESLDESYASLEQGEKRIVNRCHAARPPPQCFGYSGKAVKSKLRFRAIPQLFRQLIFCIQNKCREHYSRPSAVSAKSGHSGDVLAQRKPCVRKDTRRGHLRLGPCRTQTLATRAPTQLWERVCYCTLRELGSRQCRSSFLVAAPLEEDPVWVWGVESAEMHGANKKAWRPHWSGRKAPWRKHQRPAQDAYPRKKTHFGPSRVVSTRRAAASEW